jgi:hypothetical protein
LTIAHLGTALMERPMVSGEEPCRALIEDSIRQKPVNSLPIYCACHTDPLKPAFEEATAEHRAAEY